FFSSRRRHTRWPRDWSSDVCSSDLNSTPTRDVGYTTNPDTYGLSKELGEDLAGWQAFFEEHANPFEGWDTDANLQKWLRDGEWRSEERRVGKEWRAGRLEQQEK